MSMYYIDDFDKERFKQMKEWLKGQALPDGEGLLMSVLDNAPMYTDQNPDDYFNIVHAQTKHPDDIGLKIVRINQNLFKSDYSFDKCELVPQDDVLYIEPINAGKNTLNTI